MPPKPAGWKPALPSSRVCAVVGFLESLGGDVSVHLRSPQMSMPQQLLHASQIGAGIEEMSGVAVPQRVRRQTRVEPGELEVTFQARLERPGRHRPAALAGAQE